MHRKESSTSDPDCRSSFIVILPTLFSGFARNFLNKISLSKGPDMVSIGDWMNYFETTEAKRRCSQNRRQYDNKIIYEKIENAITV